MTDERPSQGFLKNLLEDSSNCTMPHPVLVQLLLNEIRALQKEIEKENALKTLYNSLEELKEK